MPIPRRVVLDACVLYPPSLRDLLLTLAALDAYDVVWSELILAEVEHNVLADHPDIDPARFRVHTIGAMRAAFPGALVEPRPDEEVDVEGVDPGDRHVVGAALAADADAIITINVRHFPTASLSPAGISVVTPGALVTVLDDTEPALIDRALENMSARWKNPPRTVDGLVELLRCTRRWPQSRRRYNDASMTETRPPTGQSAYRRRTVGWGRKARRGRELMYAARRS